MLTSYTKFVETITLLSEVADTIYDENIVQIEVFNKLYSILFCGLQLIITYLDLYKYLTYINLSEVWSNWHTVPVTIL